MAIQWSIHCPNVILSGATRSSMSPECSKSRSAFCASDLVPCTVLVKDLPFTR